MAAVNCILLMVGLCSAPSGLAATASAKEAPRLSDIVLGIDGTAFTLNGKKTFLLGASYYGALGAPDDFIARDLDDLKTLGFNWIRVFAVWDAFDNNVSAVDATGKAREPYLSKLKAVVAAAEKRGMVVDVTLARMPCLPNQEAHLRAVETLAKALKGCRNVYFDLANERDQNYAGGTFVSYAELRALRDRVKAADPDRLVTASGEPADRADLARYLVEAGLDFISPHLARDAGTEQRTADATRKYPRVDEGVGPGGADSLPGTLPARLSGLSGLLAAGGGDFLHRPAQRQARRRRGLVLPQREPQPPGAFPGRQAPLV